MLLFFKKQISGIPLLDFISNLIFKEIVSNHNTKDLQESGVNTQIHKIRGHLIKG